MATIKFRKQADINLLKVEAKPYNRWIDGYPGLHLRVQPSGVKTWNFQYRFSGTRRTYRIGNEQTPWKSVQTAYKRLNGDIARDIDPQAERYKLRGKANDDRDARRGRALKTLGAYLQGPYANHLSSLKAPKAEEKRLRSAFRGFLNQPMDAINEVAIQCWRRKRREKPVRESTIHRDETALRTVLRHATRHGIISANPLDGVQPQKIPEGRRPQALTTQEEAALRQALKERDDHVRASRVSANLWREKRGYSQLPSYGQFVDHLEPIVLLALLTGMRRGEIFSLRWGDIDFKNKVVRILGSGTKNGKTRTTPLSSEAVEILGNWASKQMVPADFVFPGRSGARLNNIKSAWSALRAACGLNEFRFKDLRHHAASAMVEAGVPLIAVRDILGHASIETTAKFYAGVSEKIHRDAVETITKRLAG